MIAFIAVFKTVRRCLRAKQIGHGQDNFIRNQYAAINKNLRSYKEVAKTDTAETTEGNEVFLY
jgi:hypothetical protein